MARIAVWVGQRAYHLNNLIFSLALMGSVLGKISQVTMWKTLPRQ